MPAAPDSSSARSIDPRALPSPWDYTSRRRPGRPSTGTAVKALIIANHFLETDLEKLRAAVSTGYARGKLFEAANALPRDRKDWYD